MDGAGAVLLRGLGRRRRKGQQGAVGAADGDVQQHGAGRRREQEIPSRVRGILVFLLVNNSTEDDRVRSVADRAVCIINYASAGAL